MPIVPRHPSGVPSRLSWQGHAGSLGYALPNRQEHSVGPQSLSAAGFPVAPSDDRLSPAGTCSVTQKVQPSIFVPIFVAQGLRGVVSKICIRPEPKSRLPRLSCAAGQSEDSRH